MSECIMVRRKCVNGVNKCDRVCLLVGPDYEEPFLFMLSSFRLISVEGSFVFLDDSDHFLLIYICCMLRFLT